MNLWPLGLILKLLENLPFLTSINRREQALLPTIDKSLLEEEGDIPNFFFKLSGIEVNGSNGGKPINLSRAIHCL